MFGGQDRPIPDFRGRNGMNMGPMGLMGPRPLDLPPMDMRRMDGPPMRGRDMRSREPNRDFFRSGEEPDFNLRRQYETTIREKLMNSSGFPGPGRSFDMGGRGMPPLEPNSRFMDMGDRESFNFNMQQFNNPNNDGRRGGFPMDRRERNDGFRDTRDRPPMGIGESDRFNMDLPPHERRMMDTDRRGPPFNPRGGFDSDTDFRNRLGPSAEFRGKDRSPLRFGNNDAPPADRTRSDLTSDVAGPRKSEFMGAEEPDSSGSPLMDYRSGEEMTLAEEWKTRQKDKNPFLKMNKNTGSVPESNFSVGFSRDVNARDPPPFQKNNQPSREFPGKGIDFPHGEHFPAVNLLPVGNKVPQDHPIKLPGRLGRENENKHWHGESDLKHSQNTLNHEERPPYHKEKNQPSSETQVPSDCFKGLKDIPHNQGPSRDEMGAERDFQSTTQTRDQDYRDIDYRTGSGRTFDYKQEAFQVPEKLVEESKPITPSRYSESGPQVGAF
uniref:RNA binding motif protein 6 n=1 Tax=Mola mola TaxID=94237 RepID=A0A3Q3X3W7_MOLML